MDISPAFDVLHVGDGAQPAPFDDNGVTGIIGYSATGEEATMMSKVIVVLTGNSQVAPTHHDCQDAKLALGSNMCSITS